MSADILPTVVAGLAGALVADGGKSHSFSGKRQVDGRFPSATVVALTAGQGLPEGDHAGGAGGGERLRCFSKDARLDFGVVAGIGDDDPEAEVCQAIERLPQVGSERFLPVEQVADRRMALAKRRIVTVAAVAMDAGEVTGWKDHAAETLSEPETDRMSFQPIQPP